MGVQDAIVNVFIFVVPVFNTQLFFVQVNVAGNFFFLGGGGGEGQHK